MTMWRALGTGLQALAGVVMAGAFASALFFAFVLTCHPGRLFLGGSSFFLLSAAIGAVLGIRSEHIYNRAFWGALSATLVAAAGMFLVMSFILTDGVCQHRVSSFF
jgi:hypothetical protein